MFLHSKENSRTVSLKGMTWSDFLIFRQHPCFWLSRRPRDFPCIPAVGQKVKDACKSPLAMKMSEDCFFLDLYRPAFKRSKHRIPVMVWIHGGGMTIGDSGDAYSGAAGNGTRLAVEQNVIVARWWFQIHIFLEFSPRKWGKMNPFWLHSLKLT